MTAPSATAVDDDEAPATSPVLAVVITAFTTADDAVSCSVEEVGTTLRAAIVCVLLDAGTGFNAGSCSMTVGGTTTGSVRTGAGE